MSHRYSSEFFEAQSAGSMKSARVVMPVIIELLNPRSVLDIGCGTGTWTRAAMECGIRDVMAVDGAWAESSLIIEHGHFQAVDVGAHFDLRRRFDLVVSLEVGEHLEGDRVGAYVSNLARHADAIVFSGAAPFQGGVHHVNEQWPSYWIENFSALNYQCVDVLRWKVWDAREVAPWYRQNMLIFINKSRSDLLARLQSQAGTGLVPAGMPVIHPEIWLMRVNSPRKQKLRAIARPFANGIARLRGLTAAGAFSKLIGR